MVVLAPHVETSAGIILPDAYTKALSNAAHEVGGFMVLDCIAIGAVFVDLSWHSDLESGIDVVIVP